MAIPPTTVEVLQLVVEQSKRVLDAYRADPGMVEEHANGERRISQGGYGDRQVFELVQNGADEMRDCAGGEIRVVLTSTHLYCANEGNPMSPIGAETILRMSVSRKRGGQIGRFGVGVKSVLAVTDTPQFFSTTGCFGFDRDWSAEHIKAALSEAKNPPTALPEARDMPVLRMAQPLDLDRATASDPVLRELMKWASTVVRLPLKPESVTRLGRDLAAFPVEFPLFSPHVGVVVLEDRRSGKSISRKIFQAVDGDRRTLQEERADGTDDTNAWRVFSRVHRPSTKAIASAGELHDRPELEISWALPERSGSRGVFWAYFPTKFATTLRGILNAPWKTSEDRQAIFDGNDFNDELLDVAAELVVDSLPEIADSGDPARYIDFLPGRGREAPQFADDRLTKAIWKTAAHRPSIPDQNGVFRTPADIRLHPEDLRPEWLKLWADHPGRPAGWCHHSAERRERRARVELILSKAERPISSVREWLESLVEDGSAAASALALRIAADMRRSNHPLADEAAKARITLTEADGMVAPVRGKVFRRSGTDRLHDKIIYVDDAVLNEFDAIPALELLGVHEADAAGRFAAVVDQGFHGYTDAQWTAFWDLSRHAGHAQVLAVLRAQVDDPRRTLKVRTVSGEFRPIHDCLMPGPVVPGDGSRDPRIAVDLGFHAADHAMLNDLGLVSAPVGGRDPRTDPWFDQYVESAWKRHLQGLDDQASRPMKSTMQLDGADPAGPLHLLPELSEEGRAAFLRHLPKEGLIAQWTMQVGRQTSTRRSFLSPLVWMARTHGCAETSQGLRPVPLCVGPALREYGDVFPVAQLSESVASTLRLPLMLGEIPQRLWDTAVQKASHSTEDGFAGRVYALLLEVDRAWPDGVGTRCRIGDEWSSDTPDEEIAVTADRTEYEALIRERIPALLAPSKDAVESMLETWPMRRVSEVLEKEVRFAAQSEAVLLVDEFPHLRVDRRSQVEGWSFVRCTELEEIIRTPHGMRTAPIGAAVHGKTILVLQPEEDLAVLKAADTLLGLGLGHGGCLSVLERRNLQRENARIQAVRAEDDAAAKVLNLIGEENLRRGLPQGLEDTEKAKSGKAPEGRRIAQLAMNAYGDGLLRHYSKDVAAQWAEAPSSFTGSSTSRRFVAHLGLPESYAGTRVVSPPPEEQIEGPTSFPRLHDYQERLADNMVRLLTSSTPSRGMLRLPTGAGKTRVAVEAAIRLVKEKGISTPILWIAQSDELCEQAVQSWKFVWSKAGPADRLTISRLWGGNSAAAVTSNPHLVVATDAKLLVCLDNPDYDWLWNPATVIVDEAHTAISPTYTKIFSKMGLTAHRTERPLVGLTATPFRTNEVETERLVARFGGRRLDDGVFGDRNPLIALQELGVLARVEHRQLSGGTISLTQEERAQTEKFGLLPSSAEEQLALDDQRNEMLLEEITALDPDWPLLVFATSVNHSKLLTALLNDRGVRSASIDSYMPMPERRQHIENFRAGRIRVITNYGVLAQGFDAPATRAVIIARPTYSPNIYQQMIGRGLRGPKNGGKEMCTILDVRDNIENYGRQLAFTGFEHLWKA